MPCVTNSTVSTCGCCRNGALPRLAAGIATGHGVNLLQGRYARAPEYRAALRPWKTAAALAGVMVLLGLLSVAKLFHRYHMARENAALKEQFTAEYRVLRPGDTREIVDPVNTIRSLQRGQGSASAPPIFLQSLAELAGAVDGKRTTSIEGIAYRAGVVDVSLITEDVETLGNIEQAVSESGRFDATVLSAQQVGDVTDGKLQIRGERHMKDWFTSLEAREQGFVMAGAAALVLAVLYLVVWSPVASRYATMQADRQAWADSLAELRQLAPRLTAGATTPTPTDRSIDESPLLIVNRTLTSRGLERFEQRSTPVSANGIRVEFEAVAFDDLVAWLGELDRRYGLHVQAATFSSGSRVAEGRVNAMLTLERTG